MRAAILIISLFGILYNWHKIQTYTTLEKEYISIDNYFVGLGFSIFILLCFFISLI